MRQRGFSLIEVLFGLLILTIVVTMSLYVFIERNKRLAQASETILAYQALSNEAEYWRRKPFKSLPAQPASFESDLTLLKPLEPYSAVATVTVAGNGVKNVTLAIRWKTVHSAQIVVARADTGGSPLW